MKKINLLIPALLSLVLALSCGKESKPTPSGGCPPKTCEFGMDSVTCKCLPDPNDTTGNGGTDTPEVIVSKFGNGSNGTIDTTVSNLLDRGWDRDSVYVSFYRPEMNFRWFGQGIPFYNVDGAYELLKDGEFIKLQSSKPNTQMQNQIGDYMRIGIYSIDETVPTDVYNWGEVSFALGVQLGRDDMLASLNEADMSFNYTTNIDVNSYDGTFNESQMINPSIRWKLVGRAGTRYTYYLVLKFTYNGSNYEYRTMLKYD